MNKLSAKKRIRLETTRFASTLLLATLLLAGCGRGDGDDAGLLAPVEIGPGSGSDYWSPRQDRSIAVVSVSKVDDQFVYRIHEDPANLDAVLRLASNMAGYSPDMPFVVSPGPTLTADEIAWIKARLRETGLRNIRVAQHVPEAPTSP